MNAYEEKQEARKMRFLDLSERLKNKSIAEYQASVKVLSAIPMGQPVLVGHHSEARHRRDLQRADNAMRRNVEAQKKAEYYEQKARGVGRAGISSDDPDAVEKLKEKLFHIEERHAKEKEVNKVFRKGGWAAVLAVGLLSAETVEKCQKTMALCPYIKEPFPAYHLTGNTSEMRRIKERIATIEARDNSPERAAIEGDGWRIEESREENRVCIYFDEIPSNEIRAKLKSNGFHWNHGARAWTRMLNNSAWCAAQVALGIG